MFACCRCYIISNFPTLLLLLCGVREGPWFLHTICLHTHPHAHPGVCVCCNFRAAPTCYFSHSCQILHKIQLQLKTVFGRMDLITANLWNRSCPRATDQCYKGRFISINWPKICCHLVTLYGVIAHTYLIANRNWVGLVWSTVEPGFFSITFCGKRLQP
jgi:hypothetical protein